MVARRSSREPIAYILGRREFHGLDFEVAPGVLIPRPDTETLVDAALEAAPDKNAPLRLLDLGTGSGCLLVALLARLPGAFGVGVDLSPVALACARRNLERHGLGARASLVQDDWASALRGGFDLVVSNPPYVAEAELGALEPEVRDHEPRLALAAGIDGLAAYRRLAAELPALLAPEGRAVVELGAGQAAVAGELFGSGGLRVLKTPSDLAGIPRCLVLARP